MLALELFSKLVGEPRQVVGHMDALLEHGITEESAQYVVSSQLRRLLIVCACLADSSSQVYYSRSYICITRDPLAVRRRCREYAAYAAPLRASAYAALKMDMFAAEIGERLIAQSVALDLELIQQPRACGATEIVRIYCFLKSEDSSIH